ncbi:MAG: capsule assembly Wzi family protein [Spirochaetales bacterium]|nr:capsule assembly Wzi family protein [Spirochaetales bacterium]MCF7937184.1 capsule assembly Wzi family protein [Spirochaetales bacterium]
MRKNGTMRFGLALTILFGAGLVLFGQVLYAQNDQNIIPADDRAYQNLEILYLESGLAKPWATRPWSAAEFRRLLEKVQPAELSPAGRAVYKELISSLEPRVLYREGDLAAVNAALDLAVEGYVRTDPEYRNEQYRESENTGWEYSYRERKPLLHIPLELWVSSFFYSTMEIELKKDPFTVSDDPDNYTNIPFEYPGIDTQFPFRGYLSVGGENWNLQAGRDHLFWGNGNTGSLVLSDAMDWQDYLRFTTFFGNFKFSTVVMSMEGWEAFASDPVLDAQAPSPPDGDYEQYKYFFSHRLELRLFDFIGFSLSEEMIWAGKFPELRYWNPFYIYHGYYRSEYQNTFITLELDITPFPGINVYGQLGVDQIQAAYELETYPGAADFPQARGYLAGVEAAYPAGPGYLGGYLEFVYTDPFFYLDDHPILNFTSRREVKSEFLGYKKINQPIGYFAGPDAIVTTLAIDYRLPESWLIGFEASYQVKGENTVNDYLIKGDPSIKETTPSGDNPEHKLLFGLKGMLDLGPDWSLSTRLWWITIDNYEHVAGNRHTDIQWVSSVEYHL